MPEIRVGQTYQTRETDSLLVVEVIGIRIVALTSEFTEPLTMVKVRRSLRTAGGCEEPNEFDIRSDDLIRQITCPGWTERS